MMWSAVSSLSGGGSRSPLPHFARSATGRQVDVRAYRNESATPIQLISVITWCHHSFPRDVILHYSSAEAIRLATETALTQRILAGWVVHLEQAWTGCRLGLTFIRTLGGWERWWGGSVSLLQRSHGSPRKMFEINSKMVHSEAIWAIWCFKIRAFWANL